MSCKISGILVRHASFLKGKIIVTFLRWHVLCTVHYRQSVVQGVHKNSLFTSVSQCCTNSGEWSLCWSTIHWLWQQWVASFKQVNNTPLYIMVIIRSFIVSCSVLYHLAGSTSWQDKGNPEFWLAIPLGEGRAYLVCFVLQEKILFWPYTSNKSIIVHAYSVKLAEF